MPRFLQKSASGRRTLTLAAYAKGWKTSSEYTFATYFLNSFLIIIPKVIVTVISCVLVAYAFARFDFWGKKFLFSVMVGTMMLPLIVLRLPQYLLFKQFDWIDTYLPLIVPRLLPQTPFLSSCWSSFCAVFPATWKRPRRLTVATRCRLLWYILVPILKPAIISVVVFQFIWTMNDFMGPLIYLSAPSRNTPCPWR
jgi:oligogalacturonide transport system permease protein